MKNNYGKDTNTKYQATGKENRNPNAPTQGGFTPTGGGQGKNLNDKTNKQPWGTGSIDNKNKNPQSKQPNQDKSDRR